MRISRRGFIRATAAGLAPTLLVKSPHSATSRADSTAVCAAPSLQIDADFPGGNIVLERIEDNLVYLHQDLRDTQGWWFYWYFRARGAAGREVVFRFTNGDVFSSRGPACSLDGGQTWHWLGRGCVTGTSFRHCVPESAREVRYCFAMPYVPPDLQRFLRRHRENRHLAVELHCRTRKGRDCLRLRLGTLNQPRWRVLLTCRHHACEMMASWMLEGLMEAVLAADDLGRWFQDNVEFAVIPMMDRDGVEDGDQGKNRRPHDHNRDYLGESIYPEVRALKTFAPHWSQGRLRLFLDLHCPYIRGGRNEEIFFVGSPDPGIWHETQRFSAILEQVQQGTLKFSSRNNLPFGQSWNTLEEPRMSARWAESLPGIAMSSTLEFPYATAGGREVNIATAREFGRDLARAIRVYLEARGDS